MQEVAKFVEILGCLRNEQKRFIFIVLYGYSLKFLVCQNILKVRLRIRRTAMEELVKFVEIFGCLRSEQKRFIFLCTKLKFNMSKYAEG